MALGKFFLFCLMVPEKKVSACNRSHAREMEEKKLHASGGVTANSLSSGLWWLNIPRHFQPAPVPRPSLCRRWMPGSTYWSYHKGTTAWCPSLLTFFLFWPLNWILAASTERACHGCRSLGTFSSRMLRKGLTLCRLLRFTGGSRIWQIHLFAELLKAITWHLVGNVRYSEGLISGQ